MIRLHLRTYRFVPLRLAVGRCGGFLGECGVLADSILVAAGAAKRARSAAMAASAHVSPLKRRSAQFAAMRQSAAVGGKSAPRIKPSRLCQAQPSPKCEVAKRCQSVKVKPPFGRLLCKP